MSANIGKGVEFTDDVVEHDGAASADAEIVLAELPALNAAVSQHPPRVFQDGIDKSEELDVATGPRIARNVLRGKRGWISLVGELNRGRVLGQGWRGDHTHEQC